MSVKELAKILNVSPQAVHQRLKRNGLVYSRESNFTQVAPEEVKTLLGIDSKPLVLSIFSLKGGTGKSSVAFNLAVRASMYGFKTLVLDMDMQANLTDCFPKIAIQDNSEFETISGQLMKFGNLKNITGLIKPVAPYLDIIPSNMETSYIDNILDRKGIPLDKVYKDPLDLLRSTYSLIIFDNAPALSKSVIASLLAADITVVPLNAARFDVSGLNIMRSYMEEFISGPHSKSADYKILLNKTDQRTLLSKNIRDHLLTNSEYCDRILHTQIRNCIEFPNSQAKFESVFDNTKETTAKDDIDSLTRELLNIDEKIKQRSHSKREIEPQLEI
jgi:chromosome partitioning protein